MITNINKDNGYNEINSTGFGVYSGGTMVSVKGRKG